MSTVQNSRIPSLPPEGTENDANLAASLQQFENQQAGQTQQQQQQVIYVTQAPQESSGLVAAGPPANSTKEDWYLLSIKQGGNRCSCPGCTNNISAASAAYSWLGYDIFLSVFHILGWFIVRNIEDFGHEAYWLFMLIFILVFITDIMAILAIPRFIKWIVQMKLGVFIGTGILIWIEVIMWGVDIEFESGAVIFFFIFLIIAIVSTFCTYFGAKDLKKIVKWMVYYEGGGPYSLQLP